jgi:MOSC domain-containing protein
VTEITVTALATTAVKGTRLRNVEAIELDRRGARGNRAFYVIDDRDRLINGKVCGELQALIADYDDNASTLKMIFPDGTEVAGTIELGPRTRTRFFSRAAEGRVVVGPWADALSEHIGQPLRLVESDIGVDRGLRGTASLISRASLTRLTEVGEQEDVDPRRFRMLIEIDGVEPHAEDRWIEREVRVGEALLRFNGHVGRCLITSRDPDTGRIDLPTLDFLGEYRRELEFQPTEPLPFGVYGEVLEPGAVRVGDAVSISE